MAVITMKQLLEAGVHFGHQTRRWNPKMKPYIFVDRGGIYILDLQQTLTLVENAYKVVRDIASKGGVVLFVGTKKQAQDGIEQEAQRCGMPFVSRRWLGGTITNFNTIKARIERLNQLEKMFEEEGALTGRSKKEVLRLKSEMDKLKANISGLKNLERLPDAIFVVDTKKEVIAVAEARKSGIPTVAIVDTNCDPDEVDHVIPGNDDAIRSVGLITKIIADAVLEGRGMIKAPVPPAAKKEEPAKEAAAKAEPAKGEKKEPAKKKGEEKGEEKSEAKVEA